MRNRQGVLGHKEAWGLPSSLILQAIGCGQQELTSSPWGPPAPTFRGSAPDQSSPGMYCGLVLWANRVPLPLLLKLACVAFHFNLQIQTSFLNDASALLNKYQWLQITHRLKPKLNLAFKAINLFFHHYVLLVLICSLLCGHYEWKSPVAQNLKASKMMLLASSLRRPPGRPFPD